MYQTESCWRVNAILSDFRRFKRNLTILTRDFRRFKAIYRPRVGLVLTIGAYNSQTSKSIVSSMLELSSLYKFPYSKKITLDMEPLSAIFCFSFPSTTPKRFKIFDCRLIMSYFIRSISGKISRQEHGAATPASTVD